MRVAQKREGIKNRGSFNGSGCKPGVAVRGAEVQPSHQGELTHLRLINIVLFGTEQ